MKRDLSDWGPFALHILPEERRARLRSIRTIVSMLYAERGARLMTLFREAEGDADALAQALAGMSGLPEAERRRIWTAYQHAEVG